MKIFYHKGCNDGRVAAWLWCHLHDWSLEETRPIAYNSSLTVYHDVEPQEEIIFVDFCPEREVLMALLGDDDDKPRFIQVYDHHKTQAWVKDIDHIRLKVVFDEAECGASLVWNHHHGGNKPLPVIAEHVKDWDLWERILPNTRDFHYGLQTIAMEHFSLKPFFANIVKARGSSIVSFLDEQISATLQCVGFMTIGSHDAVPTVNCPHFLASEVGHLLLKENPNAPFAATYYDQLDTLTRAYSLRSKDDRVDVGALAKSLGGGGHRNAAGFQVRLGTDGSFNV